MSTLPTTTRPGGPPVAALPVPQQELLDEVDTNARSPLRWGLAVLLLGFGGFALWAMFAPLDAGVVANATVQVSGHRKVVQHLEGGIVDDILVREGQIVEAGELVVRMNSTRAEAERDMVASEYITLMAMQARLVAERDGADTIVHDPMLLEFFSQDPRFITASAAQEKLYHTRKAALEGEIAILRENERGAQEQLEGLAKVRANRSAQINFIQRELEGVRELAREGYLPRNRMLELERDAAQLQAALSGDHVEASRIQNQVADLKLRILQRRQEFQTEVESQLSDIQKQTSALAERLTALNDTVRRTEILSPIGGRIQNLSVHTVGGVISPGTQVMEVVPLDEAFMIEAQIPVQSIDKMEPGLDVEITFPAFNHAQTPNIPGHVLTVSGDRLIDEVTRMPYYLAQIEVTPEGMSLLEQHTIRPGMPASVMIRTGERTMLSYLLKPFLDRVHKSFKEQ